VGFDVVPNAVVNFGFNYGREKYDTYQASRTSNPPPDPTFTDPRRDWNNTINDKTNTYSVNLNLVKAIKKTDIRLLYDISDGNTNYTYGLVPNTTLTAPVQYTTQPKNRLDVGKVDAQYFVRENLALGAAYWHEKVDGAGLRAGSRNHQRADRPQPDEQRADRVLHGVLQRTVHGEHVLRAHDVSLVIGIEGGRRGSGTLLLPFRASDSRLLRQGISPLRTGALPENRQGACVSPENCPNPRGTRIATLVNTNHVVSSGCRQTEIPAPSAP
jgi:hypothetical protein